MASMNSILNIGRQGIFAQQTALSVTGNNISNVNTPGYSRQRAVFQSRETGGVYVSGIERLRDDFATARLRASNARLGASEMLSLNLAQMETALGESDDSGTGQAVENFFEALQDLTLQPGGTTERDAVRSRATQLAASLNSAAGQLRSLREQANQQIITQVGQVNNLTKEIAELNRKLGELGGGNEETRLNANEILDRRDQLINELSEIVPLQVIENDRGSITLFTGSELLLEGVTTRKLLTTPDSSNDGLAQVGVADAAGIVHPLNTALTEGSLGGLLTVRDEYGKQALDNVERMAAQLIRDTNLQHRQGTGLDGVSGRDFWSGLATEAAPRWTNKGGAIVSSTAIVDQAQLTFDDYEVRFTSANQYDVVDATTGSTVSAGNAYVSGAAIQFGGMRLVLSNGTGTPAAGDTFAVNAYGGTSMRMQLSAAVAAGSGAVAAGNSSAAGDNVNALALAGLRDELTMGNPPSQTFESYLNAIRLKIGMATQTAQNVYKDESVTQQQVKNLADSVSGVSIDEEATNIIQYQRAFEAASRVITVTDELMQTLLQMI